MNKTIRIEEASNGIIIKTTIETKDKNGNWNFKEKSKILVGNEAKKLMALVTGRKSIPKNKKKK